MSLLAVNPRSDDSHRAGTDLLTETLANLREQGIGTVSFGNDVQKFLSCLPVDLTEYYLASLEAAGFETTRNTADLYANITALETRKLIANLLDDPADVVFGRIRSNEASAFRRFVAAEFSGR